MVRFIGCSLLNFVNTFLQLHLNSFPDGHEYVIPVFMAIEMVSLIGCVLMSKYMSNEIDKRWYVIIGEFMMVISPIFIGPV